MTNVTTLPRVKRHASAQAILEWAFSVERADLACDDAVTEYSHVSQTAAICAVLERGTTVQSSGRGDKDTASDAVVVAAHVLRLGWHTANLVAYHARTRREPDWMPGATPACEPALGWKAQRTPVTAVSEACGFTMVETKRTRGVRRVEVRWTPIRWSPDPEAISLARKRYREWANGVRAVANSLAREQPLERWAVTADIPSLTPWRGEAPRA